MPVLSRFSYLRSMMRTVRHPNLFEIHIRVLLNRFRKGRKLPTLSSIPDRYWESLRDKGIDWIWLMGVWTMREKLYDPEIIPAEMMADFRDVLPDLGDEDIIGSTFAIDDYEVDPVLGGRKELARLRRKLNNMGIRLMLDFIPNHYGAHTHWLRTHPEFFIQVDETAYNLDPRTFYSPKTTSHQFFAHGKDPYFEAWQDTVQVDYAFDGTRAWMTDQLLKIASQCDGVRCDMAMLPVRRIFEQTWGNHVTWNGDDFWPAAIDRVKGRYPEFKLLAEVYWDMEGELLKKGFDYCYDKTFYDRLLDAGSLNAHFKADTWYLDQTARFLENHDEARIASRVGLQQHMAAAALVAFSSGMRLWHMGQFEGRRAKTPVQVTREPSESCGCIMWTGEENGCYCAKHLYKNLFALTRKLPILKIGSWSRVNPDDFHSNELFLWKWTEESSEILVAINYSPNEIRIDPAEIDMNDRLLSRPLFPEATDAYQGLRLKPWDVRVWKIR